MKKATFLGIGLAVLLLLLALVAVVPSLIDWSRYKDTLTARLESALGRDVSIEGDLRLSLLPRPTLAAEQVRIANIPGATPQSMATLEALKVRLSLLPLLRGQVRVTSLVLDSPVVHLQRLPDGRANWQFEPQAAAGAPDGGAGAPAPEARESGLAADVRLDSVVVRNGTLALHGLAGPVERIEDIDAEFSLASLSGPFRAEGEARLNQAPLVFEAALGRLEEGRPTPASLTLRQPQSETAARLSGSLQEGGFEGKVMASGNDLARVLAATGVGDLPPPLAAGWLLEGLVTVALKDMSVRLGDAAATGTVTADLAGSPTVIRSRLAFRHINLDSWTQVLARKPAQPRLNGRAAVEEAGSDARTKAAGALPEPGTARVDKPALLLPEGLALELDATAEAVVYDGALVRDARLSAAVAGDEVTVSQASAMLPGNTQLSLFGFVTAQPDGPPRLEASFETETDNLRATLEWLDLPVQRVPSDRLRRLRASGKLAGTPEALELSEFGATLDTTRIDGAASLRLNGRPAVGLTLQVGALNLDAYLPQPSSQPAAASQPAPPGRQGGQGGAPGGPAPAPGLVPPVPAWLAGLDANLLLRVEQLTYDAVQAQGLALDGTWLAGDLTVRELSAADIAGGRLRLEAVAEDLASQPRLVSLAYLLSAKEPARLFKLLDITPPVEPQRLGGLDLSGRVETVAEGLKLTSRMETGGGLVDVDGTVRDPLTQPRYALNVQASHSSLAQLIRLFAEDYRPQGALSGFAVTATVIGDAHQAVAQDLRLRLGPVSAAGEAALAWQGAKPKLTAKLAAGEIPVDPFLPAKRTAHLGNHGPDLGDWLGAERRMALPVANGSAGAGSAHWSRDPLDFAWLTGFDANLALQAQAVTWDKVRLDDAVLAAMVEEGQARVTRFRGGLFGGSFAMTGRLTNQGAAEAEFGVDNARLREALVGLAGIDVAQGTLSLAATLGTQGQSIHGLVSHLDGRAKLAVRDGVVQGFDLGAVRKQLDNIENVGSLLQLVTAGLRGGQTRFSELTGSFRIDKGLVMTEDLALVAEGGTAQGTATIDLPDYTVQSRIGLFLAGKADAPPLVIRLSGPLDNPTRTVDVNELQAWAVRQGLGRALKNVLKGDHPPARGAPVPQVGSEPLPAPGTAQQAAEPAPAPAPAQKADPQQPPEPADIIRGILEGLGR